VGVRSGFSKKSGWVTFTKGESSLHYLISRLPAGLAHRLVHPLGKMLGCPILSIPVKN
jgi:hypothetical protein